MNENEIFGAPTTTPLNPKGKALADLVDQTYNPESENAQSGTAVAEAIKGKISLIQPKTYYNQGDIVFLNVLDDTQYCYSAFAICKSGHFTPENVECLQGDELEKWEVYPILSFSSRTSKYDSELNDITETYITKLELDRAIGQALEGDY